jgi:hypothetical protein
MAGSFRERKWGQSEKRKSSLPIPSDESSALTAEATISYDILFCPSAIAQSMGQIRI